MLGLNLMRRLALAGFRLKRQPKGKDEPATLTAQLPVADSKLISTVLEAHGPAELPHDGAYGNFTVGERGGL